MDTFKKPELRFDHLCGFWRLKWSTLEVNVEQNKFEVDIFKNVAKIACHLLIELLA